MTPNSRLKHPDLDIEAISQEQQRISKKGERTFVLHRMAILTVCTR